MEDHQARLRSPDPPRQAGNRPRSTGRIASRADLWQHTNDHLDAPAPRSGRGTTVTRRAAIEHGLVAGSIKTEALRPGRCRQLCLAPDEGHCLHVGGEL